MPKNKNTNDKTNCRLGKVGGQAVLEGVMMKSGDDYSIAVRKEDGTISVINKTFRSIRKKYKIFNIPILRGIVNYIEMMILSYNTLSVSADQMDLESEEPGKFEKWLDKTFGKSIVNVIMVLATVIGLALGILLFSFVPTWLSAFVDRLCGGVGIFKNLIEGILRIIIFIAYIALTGLMPDMKRMYQYHGAEHKSVFCYERGLELTPENAKKMSRLHPRCGTSFLFVMLILSIVIFSLPFVTWENYALRFLTKLALLPLIVGIGYEFIIYAGKHSNIVVKILSWPGLMMQKITTREPDDEQLAVAIAALRCAMPKEYPDARAEFQTVENDGSEKTED